LQTEKVKDMKKLNIIATLLLLAAGLQTVWAQGFRVYKSDGTVAQFSLRTDSIVFYDGIGSDQDFGPFTPVNQCIVGTWYKTKTESVTFNEDGTTDYMEGATYVFLPYQGNIIIYNASGAPVSILKVYNLSAGEMIVGSAGDTSFSVWSSTEPAPPVIIEHEYVDLGLPSHTLWATCNVGANSPEEYGDYFAWGEVTPKDEYNWSTYIYCKGSYDTMTKYCTRSSYGYNGFMDGLTELVSEDDAATANWGSPWKMPTLEQIQELINNCSQKWTTQGGVNGTLVTGPNGNTIFLPAAGYRSDNSFSYAGSYGDYWSSSFDTSRSDSACYLNFTSGLWYWSNGGRRFYGFPVRPVRVQN
jgi:hypothetical protein